MSMLASNIAIKGFPMLHLEDTAAFVLQCMENFDVQHLPIVKDDYFIGLISKEDVLSIDSAKTIAPYNLIVFQAFF